MYQTPDSEDWVRPEGREVEIMAMAAFAVLITALLMAVAFAVYGMGLGMLRLGRLLSRAYHWLLLP